MARPRSRPSGQVDCVVRLAPTEASLGRGDFLPAVGDLERVPAADGRLDLAVSLLALQTVNDLPGALLQMRRALKADGLLIAALIGGETLTELRQSLTIAESEILGGASPRVAPFVDVRALGGLAQRAGLALPVVDLDRAVVRYPDMFALLADLRAMGAANALQRAQPQAAAPRGPGERGLRLFRALRRSGRAPARDLRPRVAGGLGPATRTSRSRLSRGRRRCGSRTP